MKAKIISCYFIFWKRFESDQRWLTLPVSNTFACLIGRDSYASQVSNIVMLTINCRSPWEMLSGFNLTAKRRAKRQGIKLCSGIRTICDSAWLDQSHACSRELYWFVLSQRSRRYLGEISEISPRWQKSRQDRVNRDEISPRWKTSRRDFVNLDENSARFVMSLRSRRDTRDFAKISQITRRDL